MKNKKRRNWYPIFLIFIVILLILSILIPVYLIELNHELNGCGHHTTERREPDSTLWIWGRAFGFTSLIWVIISVYNGYRVNAHAKILHSKKKARNIHCITSIFSNIILAVHILLLLNAEPWKSVFFGERIKHFPMEIFQFKIISGILFAIIMVSVSILSIYLRKPKRMKKFGYKRFIWIHRIMLILTILLMLHIYIMNTEIWIMYGEKIKF